MENLAANISGRVRRTTLHGRPHLVVPLTMIVPGVLNGSQGPLLYELEDIKADPSAWNGMPVVVYHPHKNGQQVSARDPDVLEKQQVGMVLQTAANGKLRANAWLDEARLKQVDSRILNDLDKGKPVEISTGLFVEKESKRGTFNGKEYVAVARNYRPDHLAILPDQVGACSVKDGCGLLVNKHDLQSVANMLVDNPKGEWQPPESGDAPDEVKRILQTVYSQWRDKHPTENPRVKAQGAKIAWGAVAKAGWSKDENGEWHKKETQNVNLTKKDGSTSFPASAYAYVPDPEKPSTWKLRIDDAAHVGGSIVEISAQKVSIPAKDMPAVKAKIRAAWLKYHPDEGRNGLPEPIRNLGGGHDMAELTVDDRTQMIEDLIGNCDGCWNEDQRGILEGFSDEQLAAQHQLLENAMSAKEKKKTLEEMSDEELENELKTRRKAAEPAKNEFTPPANAEDWFRNAPESVQETFKVAATIEKREKDGIIDKLTANLSGPEKSIHRERLHQRSLAELQEDLSLLPKPEPTPEPIPATNEAPDWAKEAVAIARTGPPIVDDEPLGLPTMDTGKTKSPATAVTVGNVDPTVLSQLPAQLQEMVRNAAAIEKRQRAELIQQIVANVEGNERYRIEDRLTSKSIDELKDLLILRGGTQPPRKPNYRGAASPLSNVSSTVLEDENDILPLPTMSYEKKQA